MKNLNKRISISLVTIIISIIIILGGVYFHFSNEKSKWDTALAWSGISALPTWAQNKKIETEGVSFSREFSVTFNGTKDQIEEWVRTESAFKDIERKKIDYVYPSFTGVEGQFDEWVKKRDEEKKNWNNNLYKYILVPKQGAQHAEVEIDFSNSKVTIITYWS